MKIKELFAEDINRPINGVVQVEQKDETTEREVKEYVVTSELKKYFLEFFNSYGDSFNTPTNDVGVWISGFFGSGKSHFLKMLSYILENQEINGVRTVERFREKFADDPASFMVIDNATKAETNTILFNIDIQGSIQKDKTAVLRVFAKMFYNYLGFYGEDLKVAKLEQFIDMKGKTDEFRKTFAQINGTEWVESRESFSFYEDSIVQTLQQVMGMSESSARDWFNGTETTEMSIEKLVSEIKDYVNKKGKNFRLIFMADEVGQYVGTDLDLLLNLQSLVEKLGSECNGQVWVCCTGQEAIDEIIKVRQNEFSRIQARFKTQLKLSSYSVDEVIQKRVLGKTPEATKTLESIYSKNDSVLRNLFAFQNAMADLKGFTSSQAFASNYPFVPYQFTVLQKVFAEIRRHGNSGIHLSGGERSMLSGFQEAAQKLQDQNENTLAPFYLFYDTVHTFLDSTIRRVVERADKMAENGDGLEKKDVELLKLLYLVKYIETEIKSTIDNLVILSADSINMDKITKKEEITASLERLIKANFVARTGDTYVFLTNDEQDIQREINTTDVPTSEIINKIGNIIFSDIYTQKKYRLGSNDFSIDFMIDQMTIGAITNGLELKFLSIATDDAEKTESRLILDSAGRAIGVLGNTNYYESIAQAMKIRKYIMQNNIVMLSKQKQEIIRNQQGEAEKLEATARENIKQALNDAEFYVSGEKLDLKVHEAELRINEALDYLLHSTYTGLTLVQDSVSSDAEIQEILTGKHSATVSNADACAKVEEYLEMQSQKNISVTMADVQSRYQAKPYGWREIDIAAVVAQLIYEQKVTIKYAGNTIQPNDSKLIEMLRKKSEVAKTGISKRKNISAGNIKIAKDLLRKYFDTMSIHDDEDGLIQDILNMFGDQKIKFAGYGNTYQSDTYYPDRKVLNNAIQIISYILEHNSDNTALIDALIEKKVDLLDSKEDMENLLTFFDPNNAQKKLFDASRELLKRLKNDYAYLVSDSTAVENWKKIEEITTVKLDASYDYSKISNLSDLMDGIKAVHEKMLQAKKNDLLEIVRQCMEAIHGEAIYGDSAYTNVLTESDNKYSTEKAIINNAIEITQLDAKIQQLTTYKDSILQRIASIKSPTPVTPTSPTTQYKTVNKAVVFSSCTLENDTDIDNYVEKIRSQLKQLLKEHGALKLN